MEKLLFGLANVNHGLSSELFDVKHSGSFSMKPFSKKSDVRCYQVLQLCPETILDLNLIRFRHPVLVHHQTAFNWLPFLDRSMKVVLTADCDFSMNLKLAD